MSRRSNPYKRKAGQRPLRKILIVCEGEKTEKFYFEAFETNKNLVKVEVLGTGRGKDSLVEYAIELKNSAEAKNEKYAEAWCVFDRDVYPVDSRDKHKFNRAIARAASNQVKTAYSNNAFEIWYILHFEYFHSGLSRDLYERKLTKSLGFKYKKEAPGMYRALKDKQKTAIKNAKKLLGSYPKHNPESDNPCTTVHKLVEYLKDYLTDEQ